MTDDHTKTDEIEEIRLLTADDLAEHFATDAKTIERWEQKLILPPALRITRKCRRWRSIDIAEWIAAGMRPWHSLADAQRWQPANITNRVGHVPAAYVPRRAGDNDTSTTGERRSDGPAATT